MNKEKRAEQNVGSRVYFLLKACSITQFNSSLEWKLTCGGWEPEVYFLFGLWGWVTMGNLNLAFSMLSC